MKKERKICFSWKRARNAIKGDNNGFSTIITIVVATVIMAFCLVLLAAAYSYYETAAKEGVDLICKEMTKSALEQCEQEILQQYSSYKEQSDDLKAGEHQIWGWLRYNVSQDNWKELEKKDFELLSGQTKLPDHGVDSVHLQMYWEEKGDIFLHLKIVTRKGKSSYRLQRTYQLMKGEYSEEIGEETDGESSACNPNKNTILKKEKWEWRHGG